MRHRLLCVLALGLLPTIATAGNELVIELLDANGERLRHAVVHLDGPGPDASTDIVSEMDHRDMQYEPHVLPVQRGTRVDFPNRDQVRHHVYSFSPAKRFELPLYHGRPPEPVLFDRTGTVVLGCNIHDHMIGYILVLDTPYFTAADEDGRYRLPLPESGSADELLVWHPVLEEQGTTHRHSLEGGGDAELTLQLEVADRPPPGPEGLRQPRRQGLEERFERHRHDD